ncbi:MAG: exo-beta-N-acetylmuramidase NamZ domain-containing protein, partial [Flavobacteriia bacterium]
MKRSNDTNFVLQVQKYTKVLASVALLTFLLASCGIFSDPTFSPNPVQFAETIVIEEDSVSLAGFPNQPAQQKPSIAAPQLGIDRLHLFTDSLIGKRIAVVANQTSVVKDIHLVDTLLALKLNIVKVFAPEHGFRGDADAGQHIGHSTDDKTGLPLVSLYGSNKKPTDEQLADIDIVIYDIQDVGVRFYTYISTLHYVMEACAENNKQLVVLDRPNPNGHYVDGPVLEPTYKSFVGMHPVPIVYG